MVTSKRLLIGSIPYATGVALGFGIAMVFRPDSVPLLPPVQKENPPWVQNLLVSVGSPELQKPSGDLYLKALVASRESRRNIFLFFGLPGEDPTEQMRQVFRRPEVADRLSKYIPLDVDVTLRPDLVDKYDVHGTPVMIFINFREFPLKRANGAMKFEEFMDFLGNF